MSKSTQTPEHGVGPIGDPEGSRRGEGGGDAPLCARCRERPGEISERWGEPLLCSQCFLAEKGLLLKQP
ncbi:MAG TPA: hypothetical protein VFE42_23785 [Chloroflexota bacterium]|nr:hypothetical protein [Chloroflexota bacterium]